MFIREAGNHARRRSAARTVTGRLPPAREVAPGFRAAVVCLTAFAVAACSLPFSGSGAEGEDGAAELPTAGAETREAALEYALGKLGAPYEWAADGPDTFDCSGLIVWAYQEALGAQVIFRGPDGFEDDITMDDLHTYGTEPLSEGDLEPGDIVFITDSPDRITHGGLFTGWTAGGEIEFVNASSYHGEVVSDIWPTDGTTRGQWLAGAGRLVVPE